MDREYYNSLTEAYEQVQENRNTRSSVLAAERLKREQEKREQQAQQPPRVIRGQGNRVIRTTPDGRRVRGGGVGGRNSDPAPVVAPPKVVTPPPATGGGGAGTGGGGTGGGGGSSIDRTPPAPPRQTGQSGVSGYGADGRPIRTSDVEARNANTAAQAEMDRNTTGTVKAPTKPFVSRATGRTVKPMASTPRLDAATSGIGKWNEELEPLAQHFVENNLCDSIESARVILTHLDQEALQRLLS